jgi:organic hydroperoxide reductase OsmC/OhrA
MVKFTTPKELGGGGGAGNNPEQLRPRMPSTASTSRCSTGWASPTRNIW